MGDVAVILIKLVSDIKEGYLEDFLYNFLQWIPQNLIDGNSTLVQVLTWGHKVTSPYITQCWLSSMMAYVTRPQEM